MTQSALQIVDRQLPSAQRPARWRHPGCHRLAPVTRGQDAERLVHDRLRAALPAEYRLYPNVEWIGPSRRGGPAYDGEADLVVAHPDLGILILEVKDGEPTKDAAGRRRLGGHGALPLAVRPGGRQQARARRQTDRPPRLAHEPSAVRGSRGRPPRRRPRRAFHAVTFCSGPRRLRKSSSMPRLSRTQRRSAPRSIAHTPSGLATAGRGIRRNPAGIRLVDELLAAERQLRRLVRGRIEDDRPNLLEATRDQAHILNHIRKLGCSEVFRPNAARLQRVKDERPIVPCHQSTKNGAILRVSDT